MDKEPNARFVALNTLISVVFFCGGGLMFALAWRHFHQDHTPMHELTIIAEIGVGVLCWGVAWIGGMIDDKI